jgi:hypothetical protein
MPSAVPPSPVYDPFAEAEASDAFSDAMSDAVSIPPVAVDPLATETPQRQSLPTRTEQSEPLPPSARQTVSATISPAPERIEVEPPLAVEEPDHGVPSPFPQPLDTVEEQSAPSPAADMVERVVHETLVLPVADLPQLAPLPTFQEEHAPPPPLETMPQVISQFIEPPEVEAPPSPMEPRVEPVAPTVTPLLATPAPQITIGDIVVEIVSPSERPGGLPPLPTSRAARPLAPPVPRLGVRSKRGFGLGQA